jgi:biotin carboxyl carrier protein
VRRVFVLRAGREPETLAVEGRAGAWSVAHGKAVDRAEVVRLPDGRLSLLLSSGRQVCGRVVARPHGDVEVSSSRGNFRFGLADPLHDRVDHALDAHLATAAEEDVRALMPGRVIEVAVRAGDQVKSGALLLVLEAMKMQNEIRAERAGVVADVAVAAGEAVEGGARLLTLQSATG